MNEWIKMPSVKILKEEPKKDFEKSGREIIDVSNDFSVSFESFNSNIALESKEEIVQRLCLSLEIFFKDRNSKEDPFLDIRLICGVDITFFNFLLSIAKIASAYDLPNTYRAVEKHLRSFSSGFDNKNYLMYSLPKHFVGILEGTIQQEYEHSLYTRFDSNTFITMKNDGIIYLSKPEEEDRIMKNWKESHLLEKIEIHNEDDKEILDSIAPKMNEIRSELNNIYSSEYSPEGTFIGSKFRNENSLIEYTNYLKTVMEKLDQTADEIIKKNNPDIDSRFAKADDLHRDNESFFDRKLNFDVFKEKLLGLNLDEKSLYNNYLTFWSEPDIRKFLEEDLGFHFEQHNFQQQVYFLDYLKDISIKESKQLKEFSEKYGVDGFNSFLSIAYGGKGMGDKILEFGDSEKFPEGIARKVFAKYGEIIDTADNTEEEIRKIFGNKDIPERVLYSVKETLLKRGAKMLSDLGDKVSDQNFKIDESEILKELSEIKEETIILGESYIKLYKEGIKVPIEEITTTKETSVKNLTDSDKQNLMKVYENGRPKVTYENKEHLELLKKEFEQELNDENTSVLELKFKGETIIIAIVDKKDKETIYIGGLTFVNEVRNAVVAENAMSYVLDKFKNYNIKALVDSRNSILPMYLRRFGFEITKRLDSPEEMKENAGEIYYEIEKKKQLDTEKTIGKKEFAEAA